MRKDCVGHQASFLMWRKTRSLLLRLPGTGVIMGRTQWGELIKDFDSWDHVDCQGIKDRSRLFVPDWRNVRTLALHAASSGWAIRVKHLVWTSHGWWTFQMSDCQPGNHALQRSVLECGRLQINWTGSSCFSVQVWRWMVMKNFKWVVNFSCSKLLKEWWWRPTSEFVNFSCSELLIYPYLAWNDVFIPIYVTWVL